ncbi:MAG: glutamine--fructose-6-phosphate transaminase (isomerizing) [Spirochaetes bacterium]|nr:glutamine--fructose-6-phosphate transaminase (isomerizing) [Spirochaetota bacterium]
MCGIVGYIGEKAADSVLLVGLERLEYRGYDSAGIAVIENGELEIRKRAGKLKILNEYLREYPVTANIGIGHTRWATHGEPNLENAHPHFDNKKKFAVVHNGIIENYALLKEELIKEGYYFNTETDTEVIPHLLAKYYKGNLEEAVIKVIDRLEGSYALGIISEFHPDKIITVRFGSPLIIGKGKNENFIASDIPALYNLTKSVYYMEDGDVAIITKNDIKFLDSKGNKIKRDEKHIKIEDRGIGKSGYDHYMLKEIMEQPDIINNIISKRLKGNDILFTHLRDLNKEYLAKVSRVIIQAAGTSWHAGLVGKFFIEEFARIHTEVDISSEFRYRNPVIEGDTLLIAISQSGETADTLAGIREAKSKFIKVLSICNNIESTIGRESDAILDIMAGPEIGVASTKAYIAQLVSLLLFAIYFGRLKWTLDEEKIGNYLKELTLLPDKIKSILDKKDKIKKIAEKYSNANNVIFLGRSYNFPTAFEGALKLKEISYIHATGYQAGEFKHGPIALIDENVPVVCIATKEDIYPKMISNIQEVKARKGIIISIATEGDTEIKNYSDEVIYLPKTIDILSPLLNVIPLQLLAYYIAVKRGCDVDQPRNLAKSVTVE